MPGSGTAGVGEPDPAPVAAEHRRQPAPDAAVVELHVLVGAELREHVRALARPAGRPGRSRRGCAGTSPTGRGRDGRRGLDARPHRAAARLPGQGQEDVLVLGEVEHHRQPVGAWPKNSRICSRRHVRLGQHDRVAAPPGDVVTQVVEPLVVHDRVRAVRVDLLDDERRARPSGSRYAELQPEPDDLADLLAHRRGCSSSGPAGSRRSGGSTRLGHLVVGPGRRAGSRGRRRPRAAFGARSATRRTSRGTGSPGSPRADLNQGCWSEVWLTTRSMITRMPAVRAWWISSTKSPSEPIRGSTP